jgi:hypothetical protein
VSKQITGGFGMNPDKLQRNENRYELHAIAPDSAIGRWIASQDWFEFNLEEALADFGLQLRMGKN